MRTRKNIKILIATHKKYMMPKSNIYLPIHVGSENNEKIGFLQDNKGENISKKNLYYCELTAMYWAWKNLKADYIGLVHYRRYFKGKSLDEEGIFRKIISEHELEIMLNKVDIILPKKRNYYIESLYSHYKNTLYIEPLDCTGEIIKEKYPEYYKLFAELKIRKSGHMFNMFIMKKEIFYNYSEWLFDILFELEKRIELNSKSYDLFHSRFYGRISELLLDIWIKKNNLDYMEVNIKHLEKINWIKKIFCFFMAKYFKKKYKRSF